MSDTDDARSWHCGCPYDPYPDDPFQGHGPPDPDFEGDALAKKSEGAKKHECKKSVKKAKAKAKKQKNPKKKRTKPSIDPDDLLSGEADAYHEETQDTQTGNH